MGHNFDDYPGLQQMSKIMYVCTKKTLGLWPGLHIFCRLSNTFNIYLKTYFGEPNFGLSVVPKVPAVGLKLQKRIAYNFIKPPKLLNSQSMF